MKRAATQSIAIVAFIVAGFSISRAAKADTHAHLHSLAAKIDRQADQLLCATRHYRHTPNYAQMVAEVATLRAKARHMRVTTFCSRSFNQLEDDIRTVDRCFHRIEAFFDQAEILAAHGHGHIRGNTRHVKRLLDDMAETIDCLHNDVRDLRREIFGLNRRGGIQPTIYSSPSIYGQPAIYGGSRTIYSNGRSSIQFYESRDPFCPNERNYRGHRGGHQGRGVNYSNGGLNINRGGINLRIKF